MKICEVAKRSTTLALAWFLSTAACGDTGGSDEATQFGSAEASISAGACCDDGDARPTAS